MLLIRLVAFVSLICAISCCNSKVYFPSGGAKAIAVMNGNLNSAPVTGTIVFQQNSIDDPLQVTVNITGLPAGAANAKHGLHVHQNGITVVSSDVTTICGSSGPHFNPHNMTHGDISAKVRHVGDYGNVQTDANGNIQVTFNDTISKLYGPEGVIGRTIVLHQLADDLGLGNATLSLTTGNSGARIACGIIGVF